MRVGNILFLKLSGSQYYKANKKASFTKDYIKNLEILGKNASEITIACDFDIEGEVIGLNVLRFALKKKGC